MTEIEWREPPSLNRRTPNAGKGRWHRALTEVRQRPGQWAYAGTAARTTASIIKSGRLGGAKPGEFDATTRQREDGKFDIFVRYVGEVSA